MNLNLLNDPEFNNILDQIERFKKLELNTDELIKQVEEKYGIKLEKEKEEKTALTNIINPIKIYENYTDEQFIDGFVEYCLTKGKPGKGPLVPKTVEQYKKHLERFLAWYREHGVQPSIVNITKKEAGDYLLYLDNSKSRKGKPYDPDTLNSFRISLSSFYSYLNDELEILNPKIADPKKRNYFYCMGFVPKELITRRKESLTSTEMKHLLDVIRQTTSRRTPFIIERNYFMFKLMFYSGLRISEAINLRIEDIKVEEGLLYVRRGKGGKPRYTLFVESLKSDLDAYLKLREQYQVEGDYLFISEPRDRAGQNAGGKKLNSKDMNETLKKYLGFSDLNLTGRRITCHSLRHSFASMLNNEMGVPATETKEYLGHARLDTTIGTYTHVVMDEEWRVKTNQRFKGLGL